MKPKPLISILVLSVAAVLAVSVGFLRRRRLDVVAEFDVSQQRLARETATALAARLSAFDRDGALLAEIVDRTRHDAATDRASQDREIRAACQALVITVSHYRSVGVFGPPGDHRIVVVDPTEDRPSTVDLLIEASAQLADEVSATQRAAWRGPLLVGASRAFYLYGVPTRSSSSVVMTADVGVLLQDVLHAFPADIRHVVADGESALWTDCGRAETCRLLESPPQAQRASGRTRAGAGQAPPAALIDRLTPAAAAVQAMGGNDATVLTTTQPLMTPLGGWALILYSSTATIDGRQRALVWQLVLTTAGVIVAMLSVGLFVMRQQRKAGALASELKGARALANLRERSDKILDNISVGIVGATRGGRMVFANRFFQERRLSGALAAEGEGNEGEGNEENAPPVAPPTANEPVGVGSREHWSLRIAPEIERALASGRAQLVAAPASDGERDPATSSALDVRVVPLEHPVDDVAALILVEDLSELHRLRRGLVRAEKLATVGVLSAGIAHEVGTPLMVIRGRAEHLLERVTDETSAAGLEAIISQIDRITEIIRRVLEFSRAQPTLVRPTSLPEAVSRAVQLLEWRLRAKKLDLRVRAAAELPPLAADPLQLEQVLVNLIMNACDASFEGGAIDVSCAWAPAATRGDAEKADGGRGPGRSVRIDITDAGAGIRPENIHAIFDPYFTTKKMGEGTGLGLTIVSQIVHSHRGEIAVNSTPGRGTTVSLLWPAAEVEEVSLGA